MFNRCDDAIERDLYMYDEESCKYSRMTNEMEKDRMRALDKLSLIIPDEHFRELFAESIAYGYWNEDKKSETACDMAGLSRCEIYALLGNLEEYWKQRNRWYA